MLGGARGTNEDAFAWARLAHDVIGTPNVYVADRRRPAGRPARHAASHHRRGCICDDHRAARPRPQGRAAGPLPAPARRRREAAHAGSSSSRRRPSGLTRYAWKSIVYEPGTQADAVSAALADADDRRPDRLGQRGRRRRSGQPRRDPRPPRCRRSQTLLAAVPAAPRCCPAFRRGNVVGALQVGMRPGRGGLDSRGMLQAAADGKIECLILLGADPLTDFPDADLARRALPARAGSSRSTRLMSTTSDTRRRRAARRGLRREERHDHEPRGPGHHARPQGHRRPARAVPTG